MEPFSVALTVVAVATAVKDLIELAKNIEDAFSKLPANHKKAKFLMQEIREILEGIDRTYGKDLEDLDHAESLKESLNELKEDMLFVKNHCATLLPPTEVTRRKKFKIAVFTFWNRERVEELISNLKERVDKSLRLFELLCKTRTEVAVNKIHDALNPPPTFTATLLHQNGSMHSMSVSDASLFSFSSSGESIQMTWMRDTIPSQDLSRAFLRREFDILVQSVESLSIWWVVKNKADVDIAPLQTSFFLHGLPVSSSVVQRDALTLVYQIRDITESPNSTWVNKVDIILSHLSTKFGHLGMNEECMAVKTLRVKLWDTMNDVYPDGNAVAQLVSTLTGLSIGYSNLRQAEASNVISDRIINLVEETPEIAGYMNAETYHAIYAHNMAAKSTNNATTPTLSLKFAECAVHHMETAIGIIGSSDTPLSQLEENEFPKAVESFIQTDSTIHDYLYSYAHMLSEMSAVQVKNELLAEARSNGKRSLAILHRLLEVYPGSTRILHSISQILTHLAHPKYDGLSSVDEDLANAKENEEIQTQLARIDPRRYVLSLFSSMYTTRSALIAQGKTRQAQSVHQRMLDLGKMAVDNYTSLKIPSETEGDYYFKTAEYHFSCGRFQDAVYAAQNAIAQYSALEDMSPGQSPVKHFLTAAFMCKSQAFLKQYDTCIDEGFKALHLLDKSTLIQGDDIAVIDVHMELLDKIMEILDSCVDTRVLEWAHEINRRIQRLFSSAQSSGHKFVLQNAQAPSKFVSILQRNDLVEEAALYLEGSIQRWDDTYGKSSNVDMIGISYLQCLMALPSSFKVKGETDKGLYYSQQAMDVAEGYFNKGFHMMKAVIYTNLASTHIHLLCDAGRYSEALKLSDLSVEYVRENENKVHSGKNMLTQALANQVFCLLYSCRPEEAITVATEAVLISQKEVEGPPITISRTAQLTMLYISLLNLADGLADSGDMDQALQRLSEAKDALVKCEIANADDVGSDVHSYQVLAQKEARILFGKGEYAKAAELMKKVIDVERERAKIRKSLLSSLIMALQFVGILYCTMGRHEDGALVAVEIADLKRSLEDTPSLVRLLQVEEKRMIRRGKWKPVEKAKSQLSCGHQDSTVYPASYATEEPGSGVLEQATSFRDMLSRICRILIGHGSVIIYPLLFLLISLFIYSAVL